MTASGMNNPETKRNTLAHWVPIIGWLPSYNSAWLRADLVAGLVAAAVVIPQALAYASVAGLPVQVGLYVAVAPMLLYALLGTSRSLSVSSTSTISALVATSLAVVVQSSNANDYIVPAATLAFMVGLILMLAAFLRLGFIANFISLPVLTGFKAGIGVVIFVGQLGKVLGLSIDKGPIFQTLLDVFGNLDQINWPTLMLALVTIAILVFLPRLKLPLPAPLVAVALGISASALFNLEALGIALVGAIPAGLPHLSLPDWSLFGGLWTGALGIALISFVESIAAAKSFAQKNDRLIDANQELFALGAANIAAGFTQAYPAGGGTSQTAVNDGAGAKSQIAEIVTSAMAVVTLLFLAPLVSLMPEATLGSLVMVAAAGLINVGNFQKIARFRRTELTWALVAFAGVILFGTLEGILIAIILSLLVVNYFTAHQPIYVLGRKPGTDVFRPQGEHAGDETYPGLLMVRTLGPLYFANASRIIDGCNELIRQAKPEVVVLECSAITNFEYSALHDLAAFDEKLADAGVELWLAALNPIAMKAVEASELGERLNRQRMYFTLNAAVDAFSKRNHTAPI